MTHNDVVNDNDLFSKNCESGCSQGNPSNYPQTTEDIIKTLIPQVIQHHWENLSYPLSDWQKSQLEDLNEDGISCRLRMWLVNEKELSEGTYCNATWDNVYCWPPTPIGTVASRNCSEVLKDMTELNTDQIQGTGYRVCLEDSTWLHRNWTNYTECADSFDQFVKEIQEEEALVRAVQFIVFFGSIISFTCLAVALAIFYFFKCLHCDRLKLQVHLMIALMLHSITLFIITEPIIMNRIDNYRTGDFICKTVISFNLYATVATVNWMLVQGHYLHGKLTTNIFDGEIPFKAYYVIGWFVPLAILGIFVTVMEINHPVHCWLGYGNRPELWILLAPILIALSVNLLIMMDILRILWTKGRLPKSGSSETTQIGRVAKATLFLFPLLGVHHLLFFCNPGGKFNKYFVIANSLSGATQGFFVAILYCFICENVRDAIHREYTRFLARRSTHTIPIVRSGRDRVRYQQQPTKDSFEINSRSLMAPPSSLASSSTVIEMVPLNQEAEQLEHDRTPSPSPSCIPSSTIFSRIIQRCTNLNNNFPQNPRIYRCFIASPFNCFHHPDGR